MLINGEKYPNAQFLQLTTILGPTYDSITSLPKASSLYG